MLQKIQMKRWIGQGMWEGVRSFHAILGMYSDQNLQMFSCLEVYLNPFLFGFYWSFFMEIWLIKSLITGDQFNLKPLFPWGGCGLGQSFYPLSILWSFLWLNPILKLSRSPQLSTSCLAYKKTFIILEIPRILRAVC